MIKDIQALFKFKDFELITRFNLNDFASNVSSLDCLKYSVEEGANVFGIQGLHSKIYLFDDRSAIVTSANLTDNGLKRNHECGIFTSDPTMVKTIIDHFNDLKIAGKKLTITMCHRWQDELLKPGIVKPKSLELPDCGTVMPAVDEYKTYYVKFFGAAEYRVPLSFTVRGEIERALSHYACGFKKQPSSSFKMSKDGDVIYMARMVTPNDYAIFGKAEAIKFVAKRDKASKADIAERPWKEEYTNYLRVRNCTFVDATLNDCDQSEKLTPTTARSSSYTTGGKMVGAEISEFVNAI